MSRLREAGRQFGLLLVAVVVLASIFLALGVGATPAGSVAEFDDRSESEAGTAPIDPALETATGEVEVLVRLEEVDGRTLTASDDRVSTLQAHAETAQTPLERYAGETAGVDFERGFWITNAALVTVDTAETSLSELAAVDGVTRLSENHVIEPSGAAGVERTQPAGPSTPTIAGQTSATGSDVTYGLEQINAPDVWEEFETRGEGVTIAVLDSGVDPDHPDVDLYTGNPSDPTYPGGWAEFDDRGNLLAGSEPHDSSDHGTHVSGTAVGGDASGTAIGVAPEAKLIHGKVMDGREGTAGMLYGGIEWAIEQDADVIGMSLGSECGTYESADIEYVRNAREAGAIPVAAIGNQRDCSVSPGNVYGVIGVGATNSDENVWYNSGGEVIDTAEVWGNDAPVDWPESYVTPSVVAPGVGVYSAVPDDGYRQKRGTSMATPHVAGTIALMQSATDRDLEADEIETVLRETAWKPVWEDEHPDTRYGDGIVDAYAAVDEVVVTATLTGTVTDEVTGEPIPGATVTLEGEDLETTTAADGTYEITGLEGDRTYTIVLEADGYATHRETLEVDEDRDVTLEATLAGNAGIALEIEDAHFGDGVTTATVEAEGERGVYPGVHRGDGTYAIEAVPGDADYDVKVDADGYDIVTTSVTAEGWKSNALGPIVLTGDATIVAVTEDEVTGEPIPDTTVSVERGDGSTYDVHGATDGDGVLEIILPGTDEEYTLEASADGYLPGTHEKSVSSRETATAELALAGDATLEVDLEDAHFGTPITDGTVEAEGERGTYPGTHEGGGTFVVERVPSAGEYDLTAEAEGYVADERSVTVGERGTNTLGPFALTGDATLSVTVEEDPETPIDGATVSIERDGETFEVPETTGEEGGLEITVPGTGDTYAVEAGADEYETNAATTGPVGSETTEQVTVTLTAVDEGIPGFGVGITLPALAATLVATRRRYCTD